MPSLVLQVFTAFLGVAHEGVDGGIVDLGLVAAIALEVAVPLDHAALGHDRGGERRLVGSQVVEQAFLDWLAITYQEAPFDLNGR